MTDTKISAVLEIVLRVGGLAHLDPDADYYEAGMTSVQSLPVLLELEDQFQVSIPDDQFIHTRTVRGLAKLVESLTNQ
jgi:acyl carrier protein